MATSSGVLLRTMGEQGQPQPRGLAVRERMCGAAQEQGTYAVRRSPLYGSGVVGKTLNLSPT